MLFRATIALFILFISSPAPIYAAGKSASEITVVGPTQESAAFIAVRPVALPMQPGARPAQVMTAGMPQQPAAMEPEPQPEMQPQARPAEEMTTVMPAQPVTGEPQAQMEMQPQTEPEMQPEVLPEPAITTETQPAAEPMHGTEGKKTERVTTTGMPESVRGQPMQPPLMERLTNMMGEGRLTTGDREILRGVIARMRGRRLQRRAAEQPMEMPRVTPRVETTRPMRAMEPTPMRHPTMERPMIERPMMERPMATPETEAATRMPIPGARFNTAVGDFEITREMMEAARAAPESTIRDVEFNTFVGRLRGPRAVEPQWEQRWMPRGSVRGYMF